MAAAAVVAAAAVPAHAATKLPPFIYNPWRVSVSATPNPVLIPPGGCGAIECPDTVTATSNLSVTGTGLAIMIFTTAPGNGIGPGTGSVVGNVCTTGTTCAFTGGSRFAQTLDYTAYIGRPVLLGSAYPPTYVLAASPTITETWVQCIRLGRIVVCP
jgi:hypothetical protein